MLELLLECLILAGQVLFCIYIIPKTLGFLWPFVVGWLIALITYPLTQYLQNKIKVGKRCLSIFILISMIGVIAALFLSGDHDSWKRSLCLYRRSSWNV